MSDAPERAVQASPTINVAPEPAAQAPSAVVVDPEPAAQAPPAPNVAREPTVQAAPAITVDPEPAAQAEPTTDVATDTIDLTSSPPHYNNAPVVSQTDPHTPARSTARAALPKNKVKTPVIRGNRRKYACLACIRRFVAGHSDGSCWEQLGKRSDRCVMCQSHCCVVP